MLTFSTAAPSRHLAFGIDSHSLRPVSLRPDIELGCVDTSTIDGEILDKVVRIIGFGRLSS